MTWIPLSIGIDNFADLRRNGYYFVDKTLFIKELLDMKGKVLKPYGKIPCDKFITEVYETAFV